MNNLTLQMRATSKKIQKILTEGDELVQTSRRNNEY